MVEALLGKKVGMTAVYTEKGDLIPVTVIQLGPCVVVQVKTVEKDGYRALQLGFEERKPKNVSKPVLGHYGKWGASPKMFLREVAWDGAEDIKPGAVLKADMFAQEKRVDVIGTTKGRGFQGVVKRHGFKGGPKTHGQSDRTRAPGSLGPDRPNQVLKGTRMAGHMGMRRVTIQNLEVFQADPARNLLLVKGAVVGSDNGLLIIKKTIKGK